MFLDAQSSQWAAAVGVGGGKVSQIKSLSLHCNMPGRKLPRWAEPILTYSRQRERFFHIKPCLSSSTGMKVAQQREGCWEHKSHRCTEAAESAERNAERNAVLWQFMANSCFMTWTEGSGRLEIRFTYTMFTMDRSNLLQQLKYVHFKSLDFVKVILSSLSFSNWSIIPSI